MLNPPDVKQTYLLNVRRIKTNVNYFYYKGKVDGKECSFKVDTGSDVSILNRKLVDNEMKKIRIGNLNLKYPTGERVPVEFEIEVKVEIGRYSIVVPMFIADINDDCLLGADFLKIINLEKVFETAFGTPELIKEVARIKDSSEKVLVSLKELFNENSRNLDSSEKEIFADFLREFRDVFSEDIVAGNCNVVEHVINVQDSLPIKQAPRRIPIQMRGEVGKIIEDMRTQGVIEESQSPWISPAVLVRKKDGTIRF